MHKISYTVGVLDTSSYSTAKREYAKTGLKIITHLTPIISEWQPQPHRLKKVAEYFRKKRG